MSKKRYLVYRIITVVVLSSAISISINNNNWYLPIIAIAAAWIFLYTIKGKVKEILADERDRKVAGKAAIVAIQVYSFITTIAGVVLYITQKSDPTLFAIGNILLYSTCFILILYTIIFKIYERKYEAD